MGSSRHAFEQGAHRQGEIFDVVAGGEVLTLGGEAGDTNQLRAGWRGLKKVVGLGARGRHDSLFIR